jgi:hypothetical protein
LIDARQYVLRSRWQDVQPRACEQNAFLKTHSWEEYAAWHLGLTEGAAEETKARFAFVYGIFRRLHRMGCSPACGVRKLGSRGEFVFVDESADHVSALDGRGLVRDGELSGRRIWRLEAE